jgi:3-hydroxyacyl-CoA dehydrogenase
MTVAENLVRRFQLAAFVEAALLFEEGVATARDIDWALRAGAGLPLGPLEWADREGLPQILAELQELYARYGDRFKPPASLERMVKRGWLGQRSGHGYREWGQPDDGHQDTRD